MELKDYLLPIRKWWWLVLAAILIAVASSYLATRQQPPVFQARTTLMVGRAMENPNPSGSEFYLTQQLANTYADIAKREPVQKAARTALGLPRLPQYTVRVVPNTQLIELAVVDTIPARAQTVANELANQLMRQTPIASDRGSEARQAFIDQQLDDLQRQIQATQDEVNQKQSDLASLFSARQIADTQAQITGLQQKLSTLQANYAALLANTQRGAINTITIIEPAELPSRPVGTNKAISILLAAALGCLLATGAAYLLDYLDDSLKNPDQVQKVLGLTTLGAVPIIAANPGDSELVVTHAQAPATEAYRILRTNLQFTAVDRPLRTLLLTSPSPAEGKSLMAANLAAAMAQAGKQVILVDADLHRPRVHRIFRLRNNVGLTTALLAEPLALDNLLQATEVPGLRVLTTGPLPPNPAELLGTARMRAVLAGLMERADLVVLDSPPAMALADAAILSTSVDGVLLVLDAGRTRRDLARRALAGLQQVQAQVIGAVLNRMPKRAEGYYYYYYSYYNRYGVYDNHPDEPGGKGLLPRSRRVKPEHNVAS